ncbi:MAG: hypothetical protein JNJ47_01585, partial [Alphaproteobacteria bacterium]|nr:hypothetical protein [Alphaproteobacteria bacterium]
SGSIQASKIERALKSPDKTFTEDGRTYKILNDHVPMGLLSEMANDGESIRGKIQQTLGPNGIGWQFHYNVPAVYNGYDELLWSLHPNFVGSTVDFRLEDITPHPPAWYEFWK